MRPIAAPNIITILYGFRTGFYRIPKSVKKWTDVYRIFIGFLSDSARNLSQFGRIPGICQEVDGFLSDFYRIPPGIGHNLDGFQESVKKWMVPTDSTDFLIPNHSKASKMYKMHHGDEKTYRNFTNRPNENNTGSDALKHCPSTALS